MRNKFWKRWAIGGLTCATLAFTSLIGPAWAQEKPKKVGNVLDIKGPTLMTNRHQEGKWYQAYPSMDAFISERMKTDKQTTATIEFLLGGRAVVSPGTEIEIVSPRDVAEVGSTLRVKSGAFWASVDEQKHQMKIQTAGGTMGIEGTEFLVEVDEATGETKLVVIEGAVRVNNEAGEEALITPGNKVDFARTTLIAEPYGDPSLGIMGLRDLAFQEVGGDFAREVLPMVNMVLRFTGTSFGSARFLSGPEFGYAMRGLNVLQDPQRAITDEVRGQIYRHVPHAGGLAGGLFNQVTKPKEPPKPVEDIQYQPGTPPQFRWSEVKDKLVDKYAVVIARDAEAQDTVWFTVADKKREARYPVYGPELIAGQTYHLFVSPLKKDGEPFLLEDQYSMGGSTTFTASGFQPKLLSIEGLSVDAAAGPPKISWSKLKDANAYDLRFATDEAFEDRVWASRSDSEGYQYPLTARGLDEGTYYVQVDAYDKYGVKMATSAPLQFATSGWEAEGLETVAAEPQE